METVPASRDMAEDEIDPAETEVFPDFDEPFSPAVHDVSALPVEIRQAMLRHYLEEGIRELQNGEGRPFCLQELLDELDAES